VELLVYTPKSLCGVDGEHLALLLPLHINTADKSIGIKPSGILCLGCFLAKGIV
jgi:hypothetical protein